MRDRDYNVLEVLYAAWAAKDLDAVLSCFSDDVVFVVHAPVDVVPFAGETHGKADLVRRLQTILHTFDFLDYHPVHISDYGDTGHAQVHYHFRHKQTGHEIDGTLRHIWQTDGDEIVRLEEFHDIERMRAFFELLATATPKP